MAGRCADCAFADPDPSVPSQVIRPTSMDGGKTGVRSDCYPLQNESPTLLALRSVIASVTRGGSSSSDSYALTVAGKQSLEEGPQMPVGCFGGIETREPFI